MFCGCASLLWFSLLFLVPVQYTLYVYCMNVLKFIEPVPCWRPLMFALHLLLLFFYFFCFYLNIIPPKTSVHIYLYNISKTVELLGNMHVLKFNRYCPPKICIDNGVTEFLLFCRLANTILYLPTNMYFLNLCHLGMQIIFAFL